MLRCLLRKNPSSSLVSDCITAMAEGLQSCFYNQFVSLFWGDSDAAYLYSSSQVDSDWEYFSHEIKSVCTKYGQTLSTKSLTSLSKAWDFLINSKYHSQYCKRALSSSNSFLPVSYNTCKTVFNPFLQDEHSSDVSYNIRFMREILETLHALYENLKLNILRKELSSISFFCLKYLVDIFFPIFLDVSCSIVQIGTKSYIEFLFFSF